MESSQFGRSIIHPDCALCAGRLAKKIEDARNPSKRNSGHGGSALVKNIDRSWNMELRPLELKVCFINDTDNVNDIETIKQQIMKYAAFWTQPGIIEDIKLVRLNQYDQNAEIRIQIVPEMMNVTKENENFSCVGTGSLYKNCKTQASMQLALIGVEDKENADGVNMFRRRVLHEFGHAFGFEHEQSRAPWAASDEKVEFPADVASSEQLQALIKDVEAKVGLLGNQKVLVYGKLEDRKSVMMYPTNEIGWNTKLSEDDIRYANKSYPKLE